MEMTSARSWKLEFARSAALRREQDLFAKAVERRANSKLDADRVEDDMLEFAATAILATADDIDQLRIRLDRYDAATVEALMENQEALDASRERIEEMLGEAYVLPDGRRVFKTNDGLRVFDEHGVELSAEDIDPDLIEDWRTKQEDYAAEREVENDLLTERERLLEFQQRLDEARERLDDDGLTKGDIAGIEADLEALMPISAQRKLPGYEELAPADINSDFGVAASVGTSTPELKLNLPELAR